MYIKEIEKPNISLPSPRLGFSCLVLMNQFRNRHVERTHFARGSQCFDCTEESSVCWRETAKTSHLSCNPCGPAHALIAKLSRKSPYERRTQGKARWSYNKMLIELVSSSRTGKYSRSVRHDLGPNCFPSGPLNQSISTY